MQSEQRMEPETLLRQTEALIASQRTMVLATESNHRPWVAPVYYVFLRPRFCFFSSPEACHIQQAIADRWVAAAIFKDSDQWQDIQGLQMRGRLGEIRKPTEKLKAVARFVARFPFAEPFLRVAQSDNAGAPAVGERVRLYAFTPEQSFYVNNRLGFGQRIPVDFQRRFG